MLRLMDCAMASPIADKILEVTICVHIGCCCKQNRYHTHAPFIPIIAPLATIATFSLLPKETLTHSCCQLPNTYYMKTIHIQECR